MQRITHRHVTGLQLSLDGSLHLGIRKMIIQQTQATPNPAGVSIHHHNREVEGIEQNGICRFFTDTVDRQQVSTQFRPSHLPGELFRRRVHPPRL